jgi:hypothetical protein
MPVVTIWQRTGWPRNAGPRRGRAWPRFEAMYNAFPHLFVSFSATFLGLMQTAYDGALAYVGGHICRKNGRKLSSTVSPSITFTQQFDARLTDLLTNWHSG